MIPSSNAATETSTTLQNRQDPNPSVTPETRLLFSRKEMSFCFHRGGSALIPDSVTPNPQSMIRAQNLRMCDECLLNPAKPKGRFCGNACRQAAYRKSPAHRANLDKQIVRRAVRRKDWEDLCNRHKHLTFDGLRGGPSRDWVGKLGDRLLPGQRPRLAKESE